MKGFTKKPDSKASLRRAIAQELELMMAFIEQQEYQLNHYVSGFSKKLKSGGEGIVVDDFSECVSVSNLSSYKYDLESTFTQNLPNYIRKSQVLMIWAMLEDTLKVVVPNISKNEDVIFRPRDGESIFIYYIKWYDHIYSMDLYLDSSVVFLNENVRDVRNTIVHGGDLKVSHSGLSRSQFDIEVSDSYVWKICMEINQLIFRLI